MPSDIPEKQMQPWWLLLLDKTNITVTVATFSVLTFTRSIGVAYFIAGATVCSLAVKLVKKMIRQPRPVGHLKKVKKSYGMPSTHSAVIAFYLTYLLLACSLLPIHPSLPRSMLTRFIPPLICLPWGVTICVSRIWLGHHDWAQVFVGCAFGAVFSTGWFLAWVQGVNQYGGIAERNLREYIAYKGF